MLTVFQGGERDLPGLDFQQQQKASTRPFLGLSFLIYKMDVITQLKWVKLKGQQQGWSLHRGQQCEEVSEGATHLTSSSNPGWWAHTDRPSEALTLVPCPLKHMSTHTHPSPEPADDP